jgi:hypothetical protein
MQMTLNRSSIIDNDMDRYWTDLVTGFMAQPGPLPKSLESPVSQSFFGVI